MNQHNDSRTKILRSDLSFAEMYAAVERRDTAYEGALITAVKTTGIFCRPGCRARTPKEQNVEFFVSVQQSMQHGYRPCRICRPLEQQDTTPSPVSAVIAELQQNPFLRIKDQDLRDRGIDPAFIRRWFKKHH